MGEIKKAIYKAKGDSGKLIRKRRGNAKLNKQKKMILWNGETVNAHVNKLDYGLLNWRKKDRWGTWR